MRRSYPVLRAFGRRPRTIDVFLLSLAFLLLMFTGCVSVFPRRIVRVASRGNLVEIERLLAEGADPDIRDIEGYTALHRAAIHDNVDLVRVLIRNGADVDPMNNSGRTPLMYATLATGSGVHEVYGQSWPSAARSPEIAELLLQAGADPGAVDSQGRSVLMYASGAPLIYCAERNPAIVSLLLEAGANVSARDRYGRTALMYATRHGRTLRPPPYTGDFLKIEIVGLLIAAGADVNHQDHDRQTALKDPAEFGHVEFVRLLVQAGADPNLQDERGRTPFMYACGAIEYKDNQWGPGPVREIVRIMVDAGADPDLTDNEGHSAVYFGRNTPWLFDLLVSGGADPDIPDDDDQHSLLDLLRDISSTEE